MTPEPTSLSTTGFDMALMVSFFISCSILAVVQLNNLHCQRYVLFAGLCVSAFGLAKIVPMLDFSSMCESGFSALFCNNDGRGLSAFAMVWLYASLTMLAIFLLVKALLWLRQGTSKPDSAD